MKNKMLSYAKRYLEYIIHFLSKCLNIKFLEKKSQLLLWVYNHWISSSFAHSSGRHYISINSIIRGKKYITIGDGFFLGRHSTITAIDGFNNQFFKPRIIFGQNTIIGDFAHISAIHNITFGNDVMAGKWLTVVDNNHGRGDVNELIQPVRKRQLFHKGEVEIGDNVWIGDKVTILPGVKVGKNVIIGANSLVCQNVPDNCIVGGNPAHVIRSYDT